jgi:hypothetical protein
MGRNGDDFKSWYKDHMKAKFEEKGWRENALPEAKHQIPTHAAAVANDYSPIQRGMVKISSIKSSQTHVSPGAVGAIASEPAEKQEPVHLWKDSQGLRVIDGNHRINAAIQRGDTHVMAHIWQDPRK